MERSESVKSILPALLAAKKKFKAITKSTKSQHGKFADLATTLEATEPSLNEEGIIVTWPTSWIDGILVLHCILVHAATGEYLRGDWPLLPVKADPQGYGSAMTYGRRYTYLGLIGEAPEDDDGKEGSSETRPEEKSKNEKLASQLRSAPATKYVDSDIPPPDEENEPPRPVEKVEARVFPIKSGSNFGEHIIQVSKAFFGKKVKDVPKNNLTFLIETYSKYKHRTPEMQGFMENACGYLGVPVPSIPN